MTTDWVRLWSVSRCRASLRRAELRPRRAPARADRARPGRDRLSPSPQQVGKRYALEPPELSQQHAAHHRLSRCVAEGPRGEYGRAVSVRTMKLLPLGLLAANRGLPRRCAWDLAPAIGRRTARTGVVRECAVLATVAVSRLSVAAGQTKTRPQYAHSCSSPAPARRTNPEEIILPRLSHGRPHQNYRTLGPRIKLAALRARLAPVPEEVPAMSCALLRRSFHEVRPPLAHCSALAAVRSRAFPRAPPATAQGRLGGSGPTKIPHASPPLVHSAAPGGRPSSIGGSLARRSQLLTPRAGSIAVGAPRRRQRRRPPWILDGFFGPPSGSWPPSKPPVGRPALAIVHACARPDYHRARTSTPRTTWSRAPRGVIEHRRDGMAGPARALGHSTRPGHVPFLRRWCWP
jgi:hypothetical protein